MAIDISQKNQYGMNPAIIPAAMNLGSSMFGSFTSFGQQKRANRFNIDMWNRQNLYNSPKEQMRRLRDAGLNPNLIYGNNVSGAAGNTSNTPQFEKLADHGYRPVDIPSTIQSLQSFTDWDIKKATEDKLRTQAALDTAKALETAAKTQGFIYDNVGKKFQSKIAGEMADLSLEASKLGNILTNSRIAQTNTNTWLQQAQIDKTKADTLFTQDQNRRNETRLSQDIRESVSRILRNEYQNQLTSHQMRQISQSVAISKVEEMLAEKGISKDTPGYLKLVGGLTNQIVKLFKKWNQ
jgi:ATP-dependent Lon protease